MAAAPQWDKIPASCRISRQWVLWKLGERDGKTTKIPIDRYGKNASTKASHTWCTFEEARKALEGGIGEGVGLVFHRKAGETGIDLDHCRDPSTGDVDEWARKIADGLRSYTEISPSGQGVHIIVKGTLPEGVDGRRKGFTGEGYRPNAGVEMYCSGRYFTMTGNRLDSYPSTVEDRQEELTALFEELFGRSQEEAENKATEKEEAGGKKSTDEAEREKASLSDEAVIGRMLGSSNAGEIERLLKGDTSAYGGDDSAADQALCNHLAFWTAKDRLQMDRIFRSSGLMRPKWDERRGSQTYGERTIDTAIRDTKEVYEPEKEQSSQQGGCGNGPELTEEELGQRQPTFNPKLEVRLEPDNFVSKYMAYAKKTSDAYEEYHFASALVLLSVAVDRTVVITMRHGDIYPNIWIFPIGDSTVSRKTTAFKLCKLILKTKFLKKSLPSSFSPEALMDAIAETPRCYFLKDEAGSLLASMAKEYMRETRDFLAEIYECDDYYRKLKKSECYIIDPYVTQFLMTTPDNLKEYTTTLDLTSGWLLRYLWMYPNYPKEWRPFTEKDGSDFAEYTTIYGEYNLVCEKLTKPRRLSMTTEAMQFFQEWQRAIEEKSMENADNITKALGGRLMTYAIKMAALFTVGRANFDESSKIELPHIQEAARLVETYFLPIGKIIINEVARAASQNIQDKIIDVLKRFNGKISQRDLLRALHLKLKDVDDALDALILSEELQRVNIKTKKGRKVYYILIKEEMEECHSDNVSQQEVYKWKSEEKNKNDLNFHLYSSGRDTMSHRTVGHNGVEERKPPSPDSGIGPHPRKNEPTPIKEKDAATGGKEANVSNVANVAIVADVPSIQAGRGQVVALNFLQDRGPHKKGDVVGIRVNGDFSCIPGVCRRLECGECPTAIRGDPPMCEPCGYLARSPGAVEGEA